MRICYKSGDGNIVVDNIDYVVSETLILPETNFEATRCINCYDINCNQYVFYDACASPDDIDDLVMALAKQGYLILDEQFNAIANDEEHYEYVACDTSSPKYQQCVAEAKARENSYQYQNSEE